MVVLSVNGISLTPIALTKSSLTGGSGTGESKSPELASKLELPRASTLTISAHTNTSKSLLVICFSFLRNLGRNQPSLQ